MRKIHSLFGAKLLFLFFLAIVFGVVAGFIEIAFGFSLQNFLVAYHLLEPANSPFSVPIKISPVVMLILLAIIQAGFTLFNALIPYLCLEGFNKRIRYFLSHNSLGADRENNYTLTVSEVSHILTNLTPNVAIFISALVQFVIALIIGITIFTAMAKISLSLTLISLVILALLNAPLLLLKNIIQRHSSKIYNYRNEFLKKILNGQNPLEILGDGNQTRCFTHVSDIAAGIIMAMESEKAINEDFNIGTSEETKILDLAKRIWELCERREPFAYKLVHGFTYDIRRRVPDSSKAGRYFGWQPRIRFDDGLLEVINWLSKELTV